MQGDSKNYASPMYIYPTERDILLTHIALIYLSVSLVPSKVQDEVDLCKKLASLYTPNKDMKVQSSVKKVNYTN